MPINRLRALPAAVPGPANEIQADSGCSSPRRSRARVPRALFAPLHYEPNYAYPLIVWLHRPDDDEGQLKRIMPLVSVRNYVAVAPRAPRMAAGLRRPATLSAWRQSPFDVALAEERILDSIAFARRRLHVSEERVFLAGHGCGGTMAFRVALRNPGRFAAVLSLGGPLPRGGAPLSRVKDARRLPVFLACGRDCARYPDARVCADLRLFHAAGIEVTLRQYPRGQDLMAQMLGDLDRWIMARISGQA